MTAINCYIEISARNPIAGLDYVNVGDPRNTPRILVASKEQRENERSYYHEIYGIESQFIFAENLETFTKHDLRQTDEKLKMLCKKFIRLHSVFYLIRVTKK